MEALAERLVRLLEAAVARCRACRSGAWSFLAPASAIASCGSGTTTAHAVPPATLPELFAAQAAKTPHATAVVFEHQQPQLSELDARSSQLAHHLRAHGVGPEVVVGLCLERSLEMLVGLLGILKAGGAYLPLDPAYPPERLAFMLDDARAPLLLTHSALRAQLPDTAARIVCLDADGAAIAATAHHRTGQPHSTRTTPPMSSTPRDQRAHRKASPFRHAGLANHMAWMMADYPVGRDDVVLCRTAISFDAAGWEIWLPLLSGAAVCVTPERLARDPSRVQRLLSSSKASRSPNSSLRSCRNSLRPRHQTLEPA